MLLPDLSRLSTTDAPKEKRQLDVAPPQDKKQRYVPPDCPRELRYDDGEILNGSRTKRVFGASSSFYSEKLEGVPYESGPETVDDALDLVNGRSLRNFHHKDDVVLSELYNRLEKHEAVEVRQLRPNHAFRSTQGNGHKSQYYLKTLAEEATVVHIVTTGEFWSHDDQKTRGPIPNEGDVAYTRGFIWTNTSAKWSWKTSSLTKRLTRCKIRLKEGAQVLVDRSPVFGGSACTFDAQDRLSRFPDVLIPPGEFKVRRVVRYRSSELSESDREDLDTEDLDTEDLDRKVRSSAPVRYLEPPDQSGGQLTDDEAYARARLLDDDDEFVDIDLELVTSVRFPDVPPPPANSAEA